MGLQNRVDPWGNLRRSRARGSWLGNRGVLHNEQKEIVAPWRHHSWVICKLEYKDRKREVFSPGRYSELFFLDEATALSAGHRPCAECRRPAYNEFRSAWCSANTGGKVVTVKAIDKQLHAERTILGDRKRVWEMVFSALPEGTFIEVRNEALLYFHGGFKRWSFEGYESSDFQPGPSETLKILTPASIVKALQYGLQPQVHESAGQTRGQRRG